MAVPGLNPRYITAVDLEPYFVDKNTGLPLAGGIVTFFEDTARAVPKLVYELNLVGGAYVYTALPDPLILSGTGTFQDGAGNNIAVYYYPYDANGNLQLYYITVTDSFGNPQFTRQAWPFGSVNQSVTNTATSLANQVKNGQFTTVDFMNGSMTYVIAGAGAFTFNVAPEWTLNGTSLGASTIVVTQNPIAGNQNLAYNPPYTLTITPGANIAALNLTETIPGNPGLFAPQPGGLNGYVATSIGLGNNTTVTVNYVPSVGPITQLLMANNMTGVFTQYNNTVQLPPSVNPQTPPTGNIAIQLVLSPTNPSTVSNIQVVGLESNQMIPYTQVSLNNQGNQLFNYYYPFLADKPVPSFLVGWDFPFNATQALGPTLAASAAGANTSRYVWDQTILFQTTNSGPAVSRDATGGLTITATNASQFALIQYLPAVDAKKILNGSLSVNVSAVTSVVAGISGKVFLYYTTGAVLPSCAAGNSIVATLDATGKPATFNQASGQPWVQVPNAGFGDAQFTVMPSATFNFNSYGFFGWNALGAAGIVNATYFAIVVGFTQLPIGQTVTFNSISLTRGSIPTVPAYLPDSLSLQSQQYYYSKSFNQGIIPAQAVGLGTGENNWDATLAGANSNANGWVDFPTQMVNNNITMLTYNPMNANAQAYNVTIGTDCTGTNVPAALTIGTRGSAIGTVTSAGTAVGNGLRVHWTADARLGR